MANRGVRHSRRNRLTVALLDSEPELKLGLEGDGHYAVSAVSQRFASPSAILHA
jgi:hypothetical protein